MDRDKEMEINREIINNSREVEVIQVIDKVAIKQNPFQKFLSNYQMLRSSKLYKLKLNYQSYQRLPEPM